MRLPYWEEVVLYAIIALALGFGLYGLYWGVVEGKPLIGLMGAFYLYTVYRSVKGRPIQ